jgi:hypothetical protein
VAPDGASALVTWGVLNATHRASHTDPRPLEAGRQYDIEVTLDVTGWVFEPGHRIRLAISGSDWPNFWPSPYPARNVVGWGGAAAARLTLPTVPQGDPAAAPDFGPPEMPLDRYVLAGTGNEIEFTRDPNTEQARFVMKARSSGRLAAEDVVLEHTRHTAFTVSDREPGRATLTSNQTMTTIRHGTPTSARVNALLESTEDTFHLSFDLLVTVGEVERARRHWMRSYPRRLV